MKYAVLREKHPRPQWVRENFCDLNGEWEFAFDFGKSGIEREMFKEGEFPLKINVPFCPESKLSGIGYTDFIPAVWYRRTIKISDLQGQKIILHFGAVDYASKVWVNGILCGEHTGGYTPFDVDITSAVQAGDNVIVVYAEDDNRSKKQSHGKQCARYKSSMCDYTRTTGIWQSVWLEMTPKCYLLRAQITPHVMDKYVDILVFSSEYCKNYSIKCTAFYKNDCVGETIGKVCGTTAMAKLNVSELHLWDIAKPELYDLKVELIDDATGKVVDTVISYFALRDVALTKESLEINGRPTFMRLVLDQGFNPEGIYTAPNDEFLKRDIELSMQLGFHGARLHQRVFEERTLYYADLLGYIVWVEQASGVDLSKAEALEYVLPEWMETVKVHYNHPSVIGWAIFNESYHQPVLDPEVHKLIYRITKELDPYRPVIDASGGIHHETDMFDVHDYEQDPKKFAEYFQPMKNNPEYIHIPLTRYKEEIRWRPQPYTGQPYWVSEYGGTFWNPNLKNAEDGWGYGNTPKNEEEFISRYEALTDTLLSNERICGFCYTQLTDVEQEQNGLYTYDRKPKFSDKTYARIRKINQKIAAMEK